MNAKFSNHPGTILREDRLGLFTQSSFLPVHFHWTTTSGPASNPPCPPLRKGDWFKAALQSTAQK